MFAKNRNPYRASPERGDEGAAQVSPVVWLIVQHNAANIGKRKLQDHVSRAKGFVQQHGLAGQVIVGNNSAVQFLDEHDRWPYRGQVELRCLGFWRSVKVPVELEGYLDTLAGTALLAAACWGMSGKGRRMRVNVHRRRFEPWMFRDEVVPFYLFTSRAVRLFDEFAEADFIADRSRNEWKRIEV